METILIKAAQLILAFVILVTIHEFGHYIFARIFGMRVSKFYLFFNPWFSILKYNPRKGTLQIIAWTKKVKGSDETKEQPEEQKALATLRVGKPHPVENPDKPTWRDTIYGLGWVPLGGYCAIDGMIDETTDASKLSKDPEPWEFRAKKPFPRLMVMIAGVLMNFILAIIIYIGIAIKWGDYSIPYNEVTEGWNFITELKEAGFHDGDRPILINGKEIDKVDDMVPWELIQDGSTVTVVRDGKDVDIRIPKGTTMKIADLGKKAVPMELRVPVYVGKIVPGEGAAKAGISEGDRIVKLGTDTLPATGINSNEPLRAILDRYKGQTIPVGIMRGDIYMVKNVRVNDEGLIGIGLKPAPEIYNFERIHYGFFQSIPVGVNKGVKRLTSYVGSLKHLFSKKGAQSVGGFGAIGDMFPAQWDWESFWNLTAFLSVILAFMNILPIPALDGGHVLFTLYEIVTRRKPSEKFLEYAQYAGMAFLFLLLIYANFNDIYRFFFK